MRKLSKRISAVFIALMMLFVMTACDDNGNNGQTGNDAQNPATAQQPVNSGADNSGSGNTKAETVTLQLSLESDKNAVFSKYDMNVYFDGKLLSTLKNGEKYSTQMDVSKGSHELKFTKADEESLNGVETITLENSKAISYFVKHDRNSIDISRTETKDIVDDKGKNETTAPVTEAPTTEKATEAPTTMAPTTEEPTTEEATTEAETEEPTTEEETEEPTTEAETEEPTTEEETEEPTTEAETEEPTTEKPTEAPKVMARVKTNGLDYTTNDKTAAEAGNSGKFAYCKSGNYDIYYIIDFDEGYVYRFLDGKGADITCDKVKIVSGDLNDKIIIQYHDGGDTWLNGLHFRFKNAPKNLVVEDQNHDETSYKTTDINNAIDILNTKKVHEY